MSPKVRYLSTAYTAPLALTAAMSTADDNVSVPGLPLVESSCFMSAVAKLRLDGTPTPRSLGGSE